MESKKIRPRSINTEEIIDGAGINEDVTCI